MGRAADAAAGLGAVGAGAGGLRDLAVVAGRAHLEADNTETPEVFHRRPQLAEQPDLAGALRGQQALGHAELDAQRSAASAWRGRWFLWAWREITRFFRLDWSVTGWFGSGGNLANGGLGGSKWVI